MPPSGRTTRSFFRAARYGLVACVLWMGVSDAAAQLPADPGASAVATPSIEGVFDRPELGAVRAELIALRAQLDARALRREPLALAELMAVWAPIAEALAHAHDLGVLLARSPARLPWLRA